MVRIISCYGQVGKYMNIEIFRRTIDNKFIYDIQVITNEIAFNTYWEIAYYLGIEENKYRELLEQGDAIEMRFMTWKGYEYEALCFLTNDEAQNFIDNILQPYIIMKELEK